MGLLFFRRLNFLTERGAGQGANQSCIVRGLGQMMFLRSRRAILNRSLLYDYADV